ncbi:MAG: polymer-forming cytoskeletal protein [Phycisphaerales bacterium]|nr:polymer-forming cytoskeletal protein [Phycisphaerales bacterium]
MAQHPQEPSTSQPTVIGGNCRLVGELFLEGSAIIHGQIEGQIEVTETLEIGEGGLVNGTVRAGAMAVHGRVEGEVYCTDALHLGSTANLTGDVFAAAFSAEEGAVCRGQVVIGQQAAEAGRAARGSGRDAMADAAAEEQVVAGHIEQGAPTSVSTSPNAAKSLLRRRPSILSTGPRSAAG